MCWKGAAPHCRGCMHCPGPGLGFSPVRYLNGPGWEGVMNPVLKMKVESNSNWGPEWADSYLGDQRWTGVTDHNGDLNVSCRIGSKKKNWDLYPACLMEMGRICTPGTGRAVLLTQDKKCFAKVCSVRENQTYLHLKIHWEKNCKPSSLQKILHLQSNN